MGWPVTIDTTIKDVFDIFKEILVRIFKIVYWILICLGFVITIPYYRNKKSKQCSKLVMFRQKITACFNFNNTGRTIFDIEEYKNMIRDYNYLAKRLNPNFVFYSSINNINILSYYEDIKLWNEQYDDFLFWTKKEYSFWYFYNFVLKKITCSFM